MVIKGDLSNAHPQKKDGVWYPVTSTPNQLATIPGDPGAVSRVGRKLRARRNFSSSDERAPGYRLSPNYFQKFKHMSPPDWTRNTCFVLLCPIGEQFLLSSFREFVHDGYGLGYCLFTLARFVLQACACKESFYFLLS